VKRAELAGLDVWVRASKFKKIRQFPQQIFSKFSASALSFLLHTLQPSHDSLFPRS
jgi:hypothetical protein